MSEINLSDIDPEERKTQLLQETEAAKRQAQQKQAELLEAVKQEKEITHDKTEWVDIGDARFEVRCEMPGEVMDTLETMNPDDPQSGPSMHEVVDSVKQMVKMIQYGDMTMATESEISAFFDMYYQEHGTTVLEVAMKRLLKPALNNQQEMVDQSFQGQQSRTPDGFRDGGRSK